MYLSSLYGYLYHRGNDFYFKACLYSNLNKFRWIFRLPIKKQVYAPVLALQWRLQHVFLSQPYCVVRNKHLLLFFHFHTMFIFLSKWKYINFFSTYRQRKVSAFLMRGRSSVKAFYYWRLNIFPILVHIFYCTRNVINI